jgi:hypothetical protein
MDFPLDQLIGALLSSLLPPTVEIVLIVHSWNTNYLYKVYVVVRDFHMVDDPHNQF